MSRFEQAKDQQISQLIGSLNQGVPPRPDPRVLARDTELAFEDEFYDEDLEQAAPEIHDPEEGQQLSWEERQAKYQRGRLHRNTGRRTLKARGQAIERSMGIIMPDKDLENAFARTIMGHNVVEWDNGTYVRDAGRKIGLGGSVSSRNPDSAIQAAVQLAARKGWPSLKFQGDPRLADLVWMEAQRYGLDLDGYEPDLETMERGQKYLKKAGKAQGPEGEARLEKLAQEDGLDPNAQPAPQDGRAREGVEPVRQQPDPIMPISSDPLGMTPQPDNPDLEPLARPGDTQKRPVRRRLTGTAGGEPGQTNQGNPTPLAFGDPAADGLSRPADPRRRDTVRPPGPGMRR